MGAGGTTWRDPTGIRGVLRHGLAGQVAYGLLVAAVVGSIVAPGARVLLTILAIALAVQLIVPVVAARLGRSVLPQLEFRIAVVGWPFALVALGALAWATDERLGEIVALAAFVMAAMVSCTESVPFAAVWSMVAAAALTIGAAATGSFTMQTLITDGAVAAGAFGGARLRAILETYLGSRHRLMADVSRVPTSDDPFLTAELLIQPLLRWTPLRTVSLIWFRADGSSVFLAVHGNDLPAGIAGGERLPESRNAILRAQAQHGPWISGWTVRDDDGGYSRGIAAAGIKAFVYVPMVFEGRVVGLVCAGLTDRADDRSAVAEYIPTLAQYADAAALELGAALAKRDQDTATNTLIDEILAGAGYWPVFQPIRRLTDGRIVGYEALTRFGSAWTPSQIFAHARLAGRMRELELATLRAAARAAAALPPDRWLSLNCSADLLTDTRTLLEILEPIRQEVVVELSEQDVIADYRPIAAASAMLGARRRLAVDDAGAGFASLRHILEVRPQYVKLDLGLVQGVATDLTRTALIAGFVRFADDAGFELIAEGIETEADRRALRRLGVKLGQGYLLGVPELAERLTERLAS
jgi:EAL domain-containing protein (putative c-di-GMP-specific phosphodiesterase class I)